MPGCETGQSLLRLLPWGGFASCGHQVAAVLSVTLVGHVQQDHVRFPVQDCSSYTLVAHAEASSSFKRPQIPLLDLKDDDRQKEVHGLYKRIELRWQTRLSTFRERPPSSVHHRPQQLPFEAVGE